MSIKKLLASVGLSFGLFIAFAAPISLQTDRYFIAVTPQAYAGCDANTPVVGSLCGSFKQGMNGLLQDIEKYGLNAIFMTLTAHSLVYDPSTQYAQTSPNSPPKSMADVYNNYGALGAVGYGIGTIYNNPPISTSDYLATIQPIHAVMATTGTEVLYGTDPKNYPIVTFWTVMRNLSYIAFVLVMVIIGFMIMFRSKLDPRTVITVTAAIPNIIISLILITFSLMLAALMIDLGRLLEEVMKGIILGNSVTNNTPLLPSGNQTVGLSATDIWASFVTNLQNPISLGPGAGQLAGFLIQVVIIIWAFIIGIQVFFMLLMRYINLLIKPIFAPFQFMLGAIPGRGDGIVYWFKSYAVDVLVFPLTLLMLNLASAIKQSGQVGAGGDPFGFLAAQSNITSILAIGVLMLATKIPHILEVALDVVPKPHIEKGGAQPSALSKSIPLIRNFF